MFVIFKENVIRRFFGVDGFCKLFGDAYNLFKIGCKGSVVVVLSGLCPNCFSLSGFAEFFRLAENEL